MKRPTSIHLVLFMASVAIAADSTCAIDCFQGLITNGPPAGCKEATNYLCFCTMPTLQDNFVQCADKTCADEKAGALAWANELCGKLGKPIDLGGSGGSPKTDETTAVDAPTSSGSNEVKPTTAGKTTDEAPTITTEAKTESKVEESPSDKTSEATSESSAGETTATSIKTTVSKPKETKDASGSAAEATAEQSSDDSIVTVTGTADTATATPSPTDGSNIANSAGPNFYAAVGVAAALWQLL